MPTPQVLIINELRALLRLTETEIQVAETRRLQARTQAVERELGENADNGRKRVEAISAALRARGGHPQVVTKAVGRLGAVAKSNLEQAQPITEALLGDLALEHQLQDRARLLKALATAAEDDDAVRLADRLITAHDATVEWLTVVVAEVALGGPAALRATPIQQAVGFGVGLATLPARVATRGVDSLVGLASRTATGVEESTEEAADRLVDLRDDAVGGVRRGLAPDVADLPIVGYEKMAKPRSISSAKKLDSPGDLRTIMAFEEANKNRADVVSAIQVRLAELAKDVVLD